MLTATSAPVGPPVGPSVNVEQIMIKFEDMKNKLTDLEKGVGQTGEKVSAQGTQLAQMAEFATRFQHATDRIEKRESKKSYLDALWPPPFRESGGLDEARHAIELKIEQGEPEAKQLFYALCRFTDQTDKPQPNVEQTALALYELSQQAYRFWKAGAQDALMESHSWRKAFQNYLDNLGLPLEIKLVVAKDRFDMSTMISTGSSSENRINVKEPLSWIIRRRDGPVLHHGQVTTC